jgi:endonuclease/exonuclease/phosphatase family metal-dependent hydrolase
VRDGTTPPAPDDWRSRLSARRCRLRLSRVASDHLPLAADLEIE